MARSQEVAVPTEQIESFGRQLLLPRKGSFDRLLPDSVDADAFMGLAMAALYKAPKTAAVALRNPESFLLALRECAGLGLMPGTDEYALTVRKDAVVGIVQYQGEMKRMFNFGTVKSVHAEVIVRGERFVKQDPLPPIHDVPDWNTRDTRVNTPPDEDGGEPVPNLVGVYAFAVLDGGQISRVVHMTRAEVMRHRALADYHVIWDGPWGPSMWLKTAVHELEKWVPRSSSYARREATVQLEMARAARVDPVAPRSAPAAGAGDAPPPIPPDGVIDGEEVPPADAPPPGKEWPTVNPGRSS